MHIKRRYSRMVIFLISVSLLILNACAVRRRVDGTSGEKEVMPVFLAGYSTVNLGTITNTFVGMTTEEAKEYRLEYYGGYEVNEVRLVPSNLTEPLKYLSDQELVSYVVYEDYHEGAFSSYSSLLLEYINLFLVNNTMRRIFSEEELDVCSREEVIEACHPYAEACGYADSEVSVYAVKLEQIKAFIEIKKEENDDVRIVSAPGPGYQVVTRREIQEIEKQLENLEKNSNEYNELTQKLTELNDYRRYGAYMRELPWEKKHEVLILTYQPYIEGYPVNEQFDALYIIYSPLYGKPIYLQGYTPYQVKEVLEEVEIISAEEAFGEAMIIRGCSNTEDVEVKGISLVYAPQYLKDGDDSVRRMLPCWQVDFVMEEEWNRVLIDAQHGDQYVLVQEHY